MVASSTAIPATASTRPRSPNSSPSERPDFAAARSIVRRTLASMPGEPQDVPTPEIPERPQERTREGPKEQKELVMPSTLIEIDLSQSPYKNEAIHNRWHPDIPIIAWVKPGDDFIVQTYDWTGGFIKNNESADDVRDIDLTIVHFLSGPIGVTGAEPGDLLVVDLLDVGALPESLWGFNGFFSKKNGGGFLTDHFPLAQKSIWDISGLYTHSRHVPGVNFAGLIHPGLIGCLPDPKMLAM